MGQNEIRIRDATEHDAPLILRFIQGLAEYERLPIVADERSVRDMILSSEPRTHVLIAYCDNQPAGFALWFHNYSTFLARRGLYLEDLFVLPEWRGRGVGRSLLTHLARIAVSRRCGRMEWSVLNWNEPAIAFYQKLGAEALADWTVYRLSGDPLAKLASEHRYAPPARPVP
jgi:GNAT superfamily N-acetyltransferase